MRLREFLDYAKELYNRASLDFSSQNATESRRSGLDLDLHHSIEEAHIFPILAKRMPQFAAETGEHLQQRKFRHRMLGRQINLA